ncbi:MAG: acetyl-CoA C-acyltransferase [Gammaproteobacteria bacterium]|nr:acetyl-CoA C-acyltransferase [Gammaproteobacteria bacterium]
MSVYIFDAVRTPRGKAKPDGGLASHQPEDLIAKLVDGLRRRGRDARAVNALLLGCVGQIGAQGGHMALVSKLRSGIDERAAALTLNNYCVSGLTAVGQGALAVGAGHAQRVVAGGVEMMSRVPFMGDEAAYYRDDTFSKRQRYIPVVVAADRLAEKIGITRDALDAVAFESQRKSASAERDPGAMASRIAIDELNRDECLRAGTTREGLAALEPAFAAVAAQYSAALERAIDHRHTIAHAPPVCDGAALVLLGKENAWDVAPRARIVAHAESGGDVEDSLLAGFAAMELALARAGKTLAEMDRIEFMESFAVTIAKFLRDYPVDAATVNVGGGHIARGHPMGASGAILLSTLLDALDVAQGRFGLVVCTGAAGVGSAMVVERLR